MGKSLDGKNLGKGITQRKDGLYQGTYYADGVRKFLYDKNLRKLKQRIKEASDYTENGANYSLRDYTVNDIYELWVENRLMKSNLKESTKTTYVSNYMSCIKPNFGNKKVINLTKIDIENFINKCIDDKKGSAMAIKSVFIHLCKYAIDYKIINENPAENIRIYLKKRRKVEILTAKDQELILKAEKNDKYRNITMLALNTGLRIAEIFGIELSDIDLENSLLYVNKQMVYTKDYGETKYKYSFRELKTKTSKRIIPLNEWALCAINNQIKQRKKIKVADSQFKDILFLNKDGYPLNEQSVMKHYKTLYEKIGDRLSVKRIHPHMFRHTFATTCLDSDMNTRVIQKLLGHSNDRITEIYAHVTNSKIIETFDKFDAKYDNLDLRYFNYVI